jgi:type I restriction enzyme, S subunit
MSLPSYAKYKDSGIEWLGDVPDHWEVCSIKWLTPVRRGASPRPIDDEKYFDDEGQFAWVRISDVTASDGVLRETTQRLSELGSSLSVKIKPGELFISIAGTVGSPCISAINACIHDGFVYFPKLNISPQFLYRIFDAGVCYGGLGKWGTQLNLNTDTIGSIRVALPPVNELGDVLAFIDRETGKIDALVEEQRRLIELLKEKRQAVISHAVTRGLNGDAPMKDSGVEWLGKVPRHWTIARIKRLARIISKGTTPTTAGAGFTESGVRFIKAENITASGVSSDPEFYIDDDTHRLLKRSSLAEYDILVVIAGATTGKSAILPPELLPANTNQAVSFIRLSDPEQSLFLNYWLSTDHIQKVVLNDSVQSAQPNLSMEDLGNLPIALPPPNEMKEIAQLLESYSRRSLDLLTSAQKSICLLLERRTALISAAVTGKIDVRGLATEDAA